MFALVTHEMNKESPYIAFSYNYSADYHFVVALAAEMRRHALPMWYLDKTENPTNVTNRQRLGGEFNWQGELENWHATFVDHLINANGVIVVLSDGARASYVTEGRGMWRERAAVDYFRRDNLLRVREVESRLRLPT
jgi:hypothetical protein